MNRIETALNSWQERQKRYIERYGPDLLKDREFAKVKLKALKRTLRETRGLQLTSEEKDDRNILKAQVRELERKITPNLIMRFAKRTTEQLIDLIVIAWGIGVAVRDRIRNQQDENTYSANVLTTAEPNYNNGVHQQPSEGQRQHAQSTPLPGDPPTQQNNLATHQHQNRFEARKNNKQRTISTDTEKGMRI